MSGPPVTVSEHLDNAAAFSAVAERLVGKHAHEAAAVWAQLAANEVGMAQVKVDQARNTILTTKS